MSKVIKNFCLDVSRRVFIEKQEFDEYREAFRISQRRLNYEFDMLRAETGILDEFEVSTLGAELRFSAYVVHAIITGKLHKAIQPNTERHRLVRVLNMLCSLGNESTKRQGYTYNMLEQLFRSMHSEMYNMSPIQLDTFCTCLDERIRYHMQSKVSKSSTEVVEAFVDYIMDEIAEWRLSLQSPDQAESEKQPLLEV